MSLDMIFEFNYRDRGAPPPAATPPRPDAPHRGGRHRDEEQHQQPARRAPRDLPGVGTCTRGRVLEARRLPLGEVGAGAACFGGTGWGFIYLYRGISSSVC